MSFYASFYSVVVSRFFPWTSGVSTVRIRRDFAGDLFMEAKAPDIDGVTGMMKFSNWTLFCGDLTVTLTSPPPIPLLQLQSFLFNLELAHEYAFNGDLRGVEFSYIDWLIEGKETRKGHFTRKRNAKKKKMIFFLSDLNH